MNPSWSVPGRIAVTVAVALACAACGGPRAATGPVAPPATAPAGPSATAPGSSAAAAAPPAAGSADSLTRGDLLPTSPPTRLEIPALDVDVPVAGLGLRADGAMEVPGDAKTVGWFTGAPTPGALGPAILAGHVDLKGTAGTFARLSALRPGDQIRVARRDGSTAVFGVTEVGRYPKNRFPAEKVYGPIDHAGLRLITCGGDFDPRSGHYEDNVVVFAGPA
ncbi:class F sortase [Actinoplanes sp. NPDC023801]|uniref:class F sortase n=1 Tax=Actinoplanes sp. NPDC023801 TaxID=3154595 RepID=UPI0033CC420C